MKRILMAAGLGMLVFGIIAGSVFEGRKFLTDYKVDIVRRYRASDLFVRNQVLQLESDRSSCTGVQVVAPSGRVYTLTAGHCDALVVSGSVKAIGEDGRIRLLQFITEDTKSDLMLLSSDSSTGVLLAIDTYEHEKVHALTHGMHMPTYRTDGELLKIEKVTTPMFKIENDLEKAACSGQEKLEIFDMFGIMSICVLSTYEMESTAQILPGSSGGPLLDEAGNLVGIASAKSEYLNAFVTLNDIKNFLKDR